MYQHPFLFPEDESKKYKLKEHYIIIDSRDRDRTLWPTTSHFEVKLEPSSSFSGATLSHHYKNIKSIELISAAYPVNGGNSNETCLYVCIPELEGSFDGNSLASAKAFARLIPSNTTQYFNYTDLNESNKLVYEAQGKRLDRLTIQIKKHDNSFVNFGTDTSAPTAPNPLLQVNLVFKIKTVEPLIA